MEELKKILNPVLFLVIIICFFLPFFNLTCQQQKIASITGFELISGTQISTKGIDKTMKDLSIPEVKQESKPDNVSPEPLAFVAFLLAVGGLIISFFGKISDIGAAAAGLMGALILVFLSSSISDNILGKVQSQPMAVECAAGYYLCLVFFILAFFYNGYLYFMRMKYSPANINTLEENMRICPACGTVNYKMSLYCDKCGKSMDIFQE